MPEAHVRLRGVRKVFAGAAGVAPVDALGPLDLELARGEFFAVVGPSGCGKSTLLEVIAGLTPVTEGSVAFEGRPVAGDVPDGIGVVFQEDASMPWLDVTANIAFGLRQADLPAAEKAERVQRAIDLVGLADFARSYPAQLSGGMRQRVCIARTLVMQPRLILLDEPFGALDQQTRLLMGDEVLRLWRATGATVFLITHALDEAASACRTRCASADSTSRCSSRATRPRPSSSSASARSATPCCSAARASGKASTCRGPRCRSSSSTSCPSPRPTIRWAA